jgi:hypothetical protein
MALTIQFVPYSEIEDLSSKKRINKLINIVKKNSVVLMQGKLRPEEEAALIQKTMEDISKSFKGIELCTVDNEKSKNATWTKQMKNMVISMLLGHREGFTIIGPATIVKEIKKNPQKVELLLKKARRS